MHQKGGRRKKEPIIDGYYNGLKTIENKALGDGG